MPNSLNITQFGARVRAYGDAILVAQKKAVEQSALMLKRSIEQQTAIATKGSMGFSNMDTRLLRSGREVRMNAPSRLRVGYNLVGDKHPTALLVGRGPWGLIEYGSVEHTITTRMPAIQRKRVARLQYLRAVQQRKFDIAFSAQGVFSGLPPMNGAAGGGTPRYRVNHPGQKGKRPFHRGIDIVRDIASRRAKSIITNEVVTTVRTNSNQYLYVDNEVGAIVTKRHRNL